MRLFTGADERDWEQVESAFDDNVLLDYTSTTGRAPAFMTPRQIVDTWAGLLPGFDRTCHQLFDIRISESEGSANAFFRGKADHYIDKDVWVVEGTYETTLVKKGENWLIREFKFNLKDWSGNRQLADVAIARMKKGK